MEPVIYFLIIAGIVVVITIIVGYLVIKFGFPSWDDVKHHYENKGKNEKSKRKSVNKKGKT